MTSPPDHQREAISRAAVRTRRRVMISCGMTLLVALVATAGVLGAGCFDEGSYEGGGRRIGAPIQTSEEEAPSPPSNPTSTTPKPPDDSGDPDTPDSGAD